MRTRYYNLLLFFILLSITIHSQVEVSGTITDEKGEGLPGAIVKVLGLDSVLQKAAVSDVNGYFKTEVRGDSKLILLISSAAYFGKGRYLNVQTGREPLALGKIVLRQRAQELKEVQVQATQVRGEQKGDTTAFNAGAFKTNPDATAEDLIKKMPGITSDNNGVKVNGETVQKVLVDGKPFFGDDPNATIKNLPAEIIEKVQVFDRMSDQSQFSGFNDGDQQKTINFITKKEKNNGQFGRVYGAGGADQDLNPRYNAGASINSFNNKRRLSLLLLSNNVNQQNFSSSDITGAMGNSGQSQGGRQGGGGNMGGGGSSLMTSPQNGNNITQSAGLNYSDAWGSKVNVSASYFYNYTDNKNVSNISRNYFTGNDLVYKQQSTSANLNQNHRFNLRLEYSMDSANKLIYTPVFSLQDNRAKSGLSGSNALGSSVLLSKTQTDSKNNNLGYDFSNNLLLQHKFSKQGRTVSANLSGSLSERNNTGTYNSANIYSDTLSSGLDQEFNTYSYTKKASVNLSYTEPINKNAQLQANYNPSYTEGISNKNTDDYNKASNEYNTFNTALSNKYSNIYQTQKGGLSYRYNKAKLNFSLGADAQQASLIGNQQFPVAFAINQDFKNILPNAQLNYRVTKTRNFRIYYRSSTNIPTLTQLQNVIDISNPLQVRSGNKDLKQTFDNNLSLRFGGFDPKTSRNAMIFINGSSTANYISNATYILRSDTVMQGYTVKAGSQLSKPVNVDGYYTARAFFVYGFPLKVLKSNFNFNGGVNYSHTPGIINYLSNISDNYATNGGFYLGSNISQNLDFSLNYNGNYTIVKNSVQKQSDNNYFTHNASFRINWIFWKGIVINTDVTHTLYNGLSQSFNQQYYLWNAYVGYKFLKSKTLEMKVSMFDILNQNRSISRTVTGAYTEDSYTSVLRRYALLTITYSIRNFKSGAPPKVEEPPQPNMFPGGRPPGMRRPDEGGN